MKKLRKNSFCALNNPSSTCARVPQNTRIIPSIRQTTVSFKEEKKRTTPLTESPKLGSLADGSGAAPAGIGFGPGVFSPPPRRRGCGQLRPGRCPPGGKGSGQPGPGAQLLPATQPVLAGRACPHPNSPRFSAQVRRNRQSADVTAALHSQPRLLKNRPILEI